MTNTTTLFVGGFTPNNDFFLNGRDFVGFGQTVAANGAGSLLEANVQRITNVSCTIQNIGCTVVLSNTGGNSTNWISRINAADGNQLAVLTGSVTGYIQDTTHTDSLTVSTSLWNAAFHGVSGGPDCEITCHNVVVVNTSPLQEYAWGAKNSTNAGALTFTTSQNHFLCLQGGSGSNSDTSETTETDASKLLLRAAGTYKGLQATLTTNTSGSVIKFHPNGADGNQTISPGTTAVAANTVDTTHTDSIAAGDKANYRINTNALATMAIIFIGGTFAGTTSGHDIFATAGGTSLSTSAFFFCIGGSWGANNVTESQSQVKVHTASTWDHMRWRLSGNSLSIAEPFVSRNATAAGNQTVTATISGGAATLEDTTHSDSVSADALVNYKYDPTGSPTGSVNWSWYGGRFNDGSNSGSSTETGIGIMSFSGISFAASSSRPHTATGTMSFTGISFTASAAHLRSGVGLLTFTGATFNGIAALIAASGTGIMDFSGVAFHSGGFIPTPAGTGLRQFWTT